MKDNSKLDIWGLILKNEYKFLVSNNYLTKVNTNISPLMLNKCSRKFQLTCFHYFTSKLSPDLLEAKYGNLQLLLPEIMQNLQVKLTCGSVRQLTKIFLLTESNGNAAMSDIVTNLYSHHVFFYKS